MPPNRSTNPTLFSTPQARATVPKKNGMRMLNGRVYGSKHNSNPFDNARDEPKFVEWGYGGMGSVVATGTPALLSHSHHEKDAVGGSRGGAARASLERKDTVDDDDGSGMSWLRKRREERERLAREKEAQATRVSGTNRSSLDNPVSSALDTDSRRTSTDGSFALDTDLSTLAASSAPTTPPSTIDILPHTRVDLEDQQEQHILHTVKLSPKHTHHHVSHHRHPSAHAHPPENQNLFVGTTVGILKSDKNDQSPTSESSSDADGEEETLKEDDDEESESELTEVRLSCSLRLVPPLLTLFRISARRPSVLEWRRSAGIKSLHTRTGTVERISATWRLTGITCDSHACNRRPFSGRVPVAPIHSCSTLLSLTVRVHSNPPPV